MFKNCTNRDWKSKYACCGPVEDNGPLDKFLHKNLDPTLPPGTTENTLPPDIPADSSISSEIQEGTQIPLDGPVKDIETIPHPTIIEESLTVTQASFKGSLQNHLSIRPSRHT